MVLLLYTNLYKTINDILQNGVQAESKSTKGYFSYSSDGQKPIRKRLREIIDETDNSLSKLTNGAKRNRLDVEVTFRKQEIPYYPKNQ